MALTSSQSGGRAESSSDFEFHTEQPRSVGVKSEFVVYPDDGHFFKRAVQIDVMSRLVGGFGTRACRKPALPRFELCSESFHCRIVASHFTSLPTVQSDLCGD